jgi:hypothetical protein
MITHLARFVAAAALCAVASLPLRLAAAEPVALFNGRDLSGWIQRGGEAKYRVEAGEIVGTSVANTPNSFLCTERTFGDFVLEYEFKVDARLNSGVQIRSECFDAPRTVTLGAKTYTIPAGRVHGYQVEIDPDVQRGRMWSAGLYDEGRRGWLYPAAGNAEQEKAFSAQGRTTFKPGEWNHVRIEARGDSIKTWLNGTPRAEIRDSVTPRGFIALQVHSIKGPELAGTEVRWRNLRLTELAPSAPAPAAAHNTLTDAERAAGWKLLWDGRTSEGWRSAKADTFPASGWLMENGELTVLATGGREAAAGGDIITRERYREFELVLDFKISAGANSGIKYFCQPNLDPITGTGAKTTVGSAIGLEYQILDDALHPDGKLGRDGNRTLGGLYDLKAPAATKRPNPIGEWNTARLVVRGAKVEHWLNGDLILSYERGTPAFRELVAQSKYHAIPGFGEWADGHILLQDHGDRVAFRNVKLKAISSKL